MANSTDLFGKISTAVTEEEKKADGTVKKDDPQAYIFIGRDKFRSDERTPQEWRKLFVGLSRMIRGKDGKALGQNTFGLTIVYDAIVALENAAKKQDAAGFEKAINKHWQDVLKEDAEKAKKTAERLAKKEGSETDLGDALAASVEQATKTKTKKSK